MPYRVSPLRMGVKNKKKEILSSGLCGVKISISRTCEAPNMPFFFSFHFPISASFSLTFGKFYSLYKFKKNNFYS